MATRDWWLVSYDVRDDRRLRETARLLEGYGERVQYSVFRCQLTRTEMAKLRWELAVVPTSVIYRRETGGRLPMAVWGRTKL